MRARNIVSARRVDGADGRGKRDEWLCQVETKWLLSPTTPRAKLVRKGGQPGMDAEREFDFLEGQWDAVCRVPSEEGWVEAPGMLTASKTLDGLLFLEFFEGI